jgi:hypothetical protein
MHNYCTRNPVSTYLFDLRYELPALLREFCHAVWRNHYICMLSFRRLHISCVIRESHPAAGARCQKIENTLDSVAIPLQRPFRYRRVSTIFRPMSEVRTARFVPFPLCLIFQADGNRMAAPGCTYRCLSGIVPHNLVAMVKTGTGKNRFETHSAGSAIRSPRIPLQQLALMSLTVYRDARRMESAGSLRENRQSPL